MCDPTLSPSWNVAYKKDLLKEQWNMSVLMGKKENVQSLSSDVHNTVNAAVYIFRLYPSQSTRILQGDILSLSVTLKLNPRVKGWWLIIQTFLWLFCFISGLTNYCWIWIHSGEEIENLMQTKRTVPRTQEREGCLSVTSCGQKTMQLLADRPNNTAKVLQSYVNSFLQKTHMTKKYSFSRNVDPEQHSPEFQYPSMVQHWFSLKCHIWQHSIMSISVRLTTRRHPILSQVSSPLAQSASLVCHIELRRPECRHINREHHSVGSSQ